MPSNQKIIFDFPEDISIVDITDQILGGNGFKESSEEFFDKNTKGIEPLALIIRDAALALFEKKIPKDKLAGILAKHMKISGEVAEKIVEDINIKLVPFAKIIDLTAKTAEKQAPEIMSEQAKKEAFARAKEDLLKKIGGQKSIPVQEKVEMPYKKAPDITNVEKNAKQIEQERKSIISNNQAPAAPAKPAPTPAPTPEAKPDPYKEPIQ